MFFKKPPDFWVGAVIWTPLHNGSHTRSFEHILCRRFHPIDMFHVASKTPTTWWDVIIRVKFGPVDESSIMDCLAGWKNFERCDRPWSGIFLLLLFFFSILRRGWLIIDSEGQVGEICCFMVKIKLAKFAYASFFFLKMLMRG